MKITKEIVDRLEWYDGGDGIEYEKWIDPETNIIWRVPIEIIRDFYDAEEN